MMMKQVLILFLICSLALQAFGQDSVHVREVYWKIPNQYLDILVGANDKESRNKIITHHQPGNGYLKLEKEGSTLKVALQLYRSDKDEWFVVIETSSCDGRNCGSRKLVVLDALTMNEVSEKVFPDYRITAKAVNTEVKDAYKEAYQTDEFYKENGYKKDDILEKSLYWQIDRTTKIISLNETKLPFVVRRYAWNSRKAIFEPLKD